MGVIGGVDVKPGSIFDNIGDDNMDNMEPLDPSDLFREGLCKEDDFAATFGMNIHSLTTLTGSPVRLVTRPINMTSAPVTILSNMPSMTTSGDQKLSFITIKNPLEKQKIVLS